MKQIAAILFMLVSTLSFAQSGKVNVVVFSEDGHPFWVVINGIRQNMNPETNVRVTDLTMESFSFKIIFKDEKLKPISKTQYLPFGNEYTFRIKADKKGNLVMRPFGEVALNESTSTAPSVAYHATENTPVNNTVATQPQTNSSGQVNSSTQVTETTVVTTTTTSGSSSGSTVNTSSNGINMNTSMNVNETQSNKGENVNVNTNTQVNGMDMGVNMNVNETQTSNGENVAVNMNVGGVGVNMNINVNDNMNGGAVNSSVNTGANTDVQYTETITTTTTTTTTSGSSAGTVNTSSQVSEPVNTVTSNTSANGRCVNPVSSVEFKEITSSLSSKSFSDSKMKVAQQATKSNCLSSVQVKEIMGIFDFEDDRLEYAKFAYAYVCDPNNYFKVNDAFDFESSIEELDAYISSKK